MEDFRALRYLAEKFYPEIPQIFYISVLVSVYKGNNAPGAGRHYSEAQLFTQKKDILIGNGGCCFSKRMRKVFRKNEKSMLQNCNKKAKRKGRLQRVKKPM